MSAFPTLKTERLVLREIVDTDADDLYRIFSDEEAMRYWSSRPYTSIDRARQLIEKMAAARVAEASIHWGITFRGENRLIGKCAFNEWRRAHRRGEISYIVAREHWGKGVVSEALRAMLGYGFEEMNLHSVEAGVTPGNEASTRLLERLGFRLEGHLHENYLADDVFIDSLIYSLLRREWKG